MTPVYEIHDAVKLGRKNLTSNDISSYMYVSVKLDIEYFKN